MNPEVLYLSGLVSLLGIGLLILIMVPWPIPPSTLPESEIPSGVNIALPFLFNWSKPIMLYFVLLTGVSMSLLWWSQTTLRRQNRVSL